MLRRFTTPVICFVIIMDRCNVVTNYSPPLIAGLWCEPSFFYHFNKDGLFVIIMDRYNVVTNYSPPLIAGLWCEPSFFYHFNKDGLFERLVLLISSTQ